MAFTNTYDTTFPADTQLANLLGADLRNFRLDTQQRMAAISGLDAAKPTFNLDAQPANWNGVLFFAIDTGKIYKFTNPTWTDLTSNFILRNPTIKNLTPVTQTGDIAIHTLYTQAIAGGLMGTTGHLRITVPMNIQVQGALNGLFFIYYGGIQIAQFAIPNTFAGNNGVYASVIGGNLGVTNSQSWDATMVHLDTTYLASSTSIGPNVGNIHHVTSAVDSTISQNLLVQYQGGANTDQITVYKLIIEVI